MLVNECQTEETSVQKGMKQGEPLAPFLFLLVVEDLNASLKIVRSTGEFSVERYPDVLFVLYEDVDFILAEIDQLRKAFS